VPILSAAHIHQLFSPRLFRRGGAVFFTNAVAKALTSDGSYHDLDLSSDIGSDSAVAAIFEVCDSSDVSSTLYYRKKGGTGDPGGTHRLHSPWLQV
jgi:hypothetical protein